jgi:PAS domain-containing protein
MTIVYSVEEIQELTCFPSGTAWCIVSLMHPRSDSPIERDPAISFTRPQESNVSTRLRLQPCLVVALTLAVLLVVLSFLSSSFPLARGATLVAAVAVVLVLAVALYAHLGDSHGRASLLEDQQYFDALFADAPLGVALSSQEGRIVRANSAFRAMLGPQSGDPTDHLVNELFVARDGKLESDPDGESVAHNRRMYQVAARSMGRMPPAGSRSRDSRPAVATEDRRTMWLWLKIGPSRAGLTWHAGASRHSKRCSRPRRAHWPIPVI